MQLRINATNVKIVMFIKSNDKDAYCAHENARDARNVENIDAFMNMSQLKVTQIWNMRLNEYSRYWSLEALKSVSVTLYKLRMYVDLLHLLDYFNYQFDLKNYFEVQINDDKWTAIILVKSFIFFNTTDVSVVLHHFLIKTDWNSIKLKLMFDLCKHERQNDDKQVLQYCFFDASNMISVCSIMFDKLNKIKIATIRILNSAHIDKKYYEYNDCFRDIILSQNLHIKFTSVLFEDLNLLTTLAEWNIELNKSQMLIM